MTEISDRYRKACEGFTKVVDGVSADGWSNPSPCEGWTARDVTAHLVDATRGFYERAGKPLPDAPSAQEDAAGAWAATRDAAQASLEDPATAGHEHEGFMGPTTLEAAIDRFMVGDTLVHSWDLAQATGQDVQLDETLLTRYEAGLRAMPNVPRGPESGVFGDEVAAPEGADLQTRVLAFVGRRAF